MSDYGELRRGPGRPRRVLEAGAVPVAAEPVMAPAIEEPEPEPVMDTLDWRIMADAPRDGTVIEVKEGRQNDDGETVPARWYATRVRDAANRRWTPSGWWVDPLTRARLTFEPGCWRMMAGFLPPGMIAA